MRRVFWQFPVLLFAATAVGAQPAPPESKPEVTVTAPRDEQALPDLRDDEFRTCAGMSGAGNLDYTQMVLCNEQLSREKHMVVAACVNLEGDSPPSRVIQACTESLDRDIYEGNARFFLFACRAAAYFALGDKQHALDDYNEAVKLAPKNSYVYYNRGVFY